MSIPSTAVPTFERQTLDNGLRVLTASMPQVQSVSCFIMLAAGSRYEEPEANGIAHFSEHMFFKGTERRPTARDISAEIDAIGGEFNAFTGKEYTAYYVRCATEYRDVALDVLVDMLRHAKFDPDEIEREKGVILEEMNMYVDTPRDYISRVYDELVYADEPLGRNILGTKETIQAATRHTFREYVGHWYTPERIVVGLAGNLGDAPVEKIAELLSDLPAAPTSKPPPSSFAENGRVKVHEKASDQAHVCLGVPGYEIAHPDRYAVEILRTVLGGGMSSRLFTEVRERRGLAYYVFAANQAYTDSGTLYSQAGVDLKRVDEAVDDDPCRAAQDRRRAGAGGRAREGAVVREGALRPLAREPAGDEHVRPPPRGARGPGNRAGRGAGGAGQGHGRGRAPRRPGPDARRGAAPGRDRPVRRRRSLPEPAFLARTVLHAAPPASPAERARRPGDRVALRRRQLEAGSIRKTAPVNETA